jgi:hypothetical protein
VIISRESTLGEVAAAVTAALDRAGISAVLTGGACATIYSDGAYQSYDLDFVIRGHATRQALDRALAGIGFERDGDRYVHSSTEFFVEFPRGPLAIGDDVQITPVTLPLRYGSVTALSSTDACRDRLAAFYHWSDRQSLTAAVEIASRQRIDMAAVRLWSDSEGFQEKFREFLQELKRKRTTSRTRRSRAARGT